MPYCGRKLSRIEGESSALSANTDDRLELAVVVHGVPSRSGIVEKLFSKFPLSSKSVDFIPNSLRLGFLHATRPADVPFIQPRWS